MANICDFQMVLTGSEKNIETFKEMMQRIGTIHMGDGAEIDNDDMEEIDDDFYRCELEGSVKWSVKSALVDSAIAMRTNPDEFYFGDIDVSNISFITLFEACKQLNLDMEYYSIEGGCESQEHCLLIDGVLIEDECIEYSEEYDEDTDEWVSTGGFGEWEFAI